MSQYQKHDFVLSGFAGGWEYYDCERCALGEIPSVFGFMWSNLRLVQWLMPSRRCTKDWITDEELTSMEKLAKFYSLGPEPTCGGECA